MRYAGSGSGRSQLHLRQTVIRSLRAGVPTVLTLALFQCGPAPAPPPSPQLAPPEARAIILCPALPDIPADDGDVRSRRVYYAESRGMYALCRDRHAALADYVATVRQRKE